MNSVNRSMLIKVAKLYYYGNLSQDKIAKIIGVSRSKISRMLSMARKLNIVDINIAESPLLNEQMEAKIKEHFGLKYVKIVPSSLITINTQRTAGRAAGEYLNSIMFNGMYLGISWGTTMDSFVSQFMPTRLVDAVTVVQLTGGIRSETFHVDSRELAISLAQKLHASYSLLQAPLVVSNSSVRNMLLAEPEFVSHFNLFKKLDVAVVGVGSTIPEQSALYKAGYITYEQSKTLIQDGFAADICGNRIYQDGSIKPNFLSDRLIAIPPEQIRDIPMVIGVAIGEDKADPLITVAKGKFVKALIIDEVAAIAMIEHENIL